MGQAEDPIENQVEMNSWYGFELWEASLCLAERDEKISVQMIVGDAYQPGVAVQNKAPARKKLRYLDISRYNSFTSKRRTDDGEAS